MAGALTDVAYEGVSWLSPGSLPHLISRYTTQADNYATEKGSKDFIKGLARQPKKVISIDSKRKSKEDLEKIAEAA